MKNNKNKHMKYLKMFRFRPNLIVLIILMFVCYSCRENIDKSPVVRENIEWLDVWIPHTNENKLTKILFIGNSIMRGYGKKVEQLLKDKAYVSRLCTSMSIGDPRLIQEIDLVMGYQNFDVVHFNNGLHGWGYTEDQYRDSFPEFIKTIQKNAPGATLIWATITPVYQKDNFGQLDPKTERIKKRNKIALDYLEDHKQIRINDLFNLAIQHPEYFEGGDVPHQNTNSYSKIAEHVASDVEMLWR